MEVETLIDQNRQKKTDTQPSEEGRISINIRQTDILSRSPHKANSAEEKLLKKLNMMFDNIPDELYESYQKQNKNIITIDTVKDILYGDADEAKIEEYASDFTDLCVDLLIGYYQNLKIGLYKGLVKPDNPYARSAGPILPICELLEKHRQDLEQKSSYYTKKSI